MYLFCDSTWLIQNDLGAQAIDFNGNLVVNDDGDAVAINAIPAYITLLANGGNVPWWSGTFTSPPVYGYSFAPAVSGGNYC